MSSEIVERVAEQLYEDRGEGLKKARTVEVRPKWRALSESERAHYKEIVEEVLTAAMNAQLVIREMAFERAEKKA